MPLAAERINASLTDAPWMICSGGMGKGGPPYPITLDQMIHGSAVTEAIVRSAKSGQVEKIP